MLPAVVVAVALLSGCAGAQIEQMQNEIRSLRDELDELKQGQAAQRVQFDEFRNRLVTIEDKADSARVERSRRGDAWIPDLPTVRVQPALREEAPIVVARGPIDAPQDQDTPAGPSGPAGDPPPQEAGVKPRLDQAAALYSQAMTLLQAGQMPAARALFTQLHAQHPDHSLADNALYWIGESFYGQSLWLQAAQSFLRVAKEFPRGNKVPDAMLKLGKSYRNLGDDAGAGEVLRQLARLYPGTPPAQLASEELARMGSRSQP